MRKCRILVPIGCRSDAGLSAPIIRRLMKHEDFECHTINLKPACFIESYQITEKDIKKHNIDLVLCVADRVEMAAVACAAFHNHVKIAHVYAGVIDTSFVLFDDINRHVITLYADIAFCEDSKSAEVVEELWETIGKYNPKRFREDIHVVGISHLDDLEIDESLVPRYRYCDKCEILLDCKEPNGIGCIEPYDLILINPTTTVEEINYIESDFAIIIEGNPDPHVLQANNIVDVKRHISYDNLPRPQFLGLLKNCSRYITNSSNINYEARPLGLKDEQIIQIGLRNKGRSTPKKLETGASQKIVDILETYYKDTLNS